MAVAMMSLRTVRTYRRQREMGEAHSDLAPKNTKIAIFLPKLICKVTITCTGKSMSARSVRILKTPMLSQKDVLRTVSIVRWCEIELVPTMSRQPWPELMNRHGSELPHENAATNSEMKPHSAIIPVKPMPRLRCKSDAVKIIRSEMIDNFANTSVAM